MGVEIKEGRAGTARTLDAVTPAYAAEWVEAVADERDEARRATIFGNVKVRAIPAVGKQRPTNRALKTAASHLCKGSWAGEIDKERGLDVVTAEVSGEDDSDWIDDDVQTIRQDGEIVICLTVTASPMQIDSGTLSFCGQASDGDCQPNGSK